MSKVPYYPNAQTNPDFAAIEKKILKFWQENKIFEQSVEKNSNLEEFVFYDGPPFANGLPHYGHLLTGFIKDTYARFQTMKGKRVERRFGWDCHGLPAEMAAEKELGISGRSDITKFGIDKFNNHCKESVMKYERLWQEYVTRQGRWVDFTNSYKTMDRNFMESVLWAFKELYKKGFIYEAMKVMPYSWACQTPLSNFETRLDNSYRQRADKAVTVSFTLKDKPLSAPEGFEQYKILAWTTTPWTLPSNLALAVGDQIEYVAVGQGNICYILAKSALEKYRNELAFNQDITLTTISAEELSNLKYEPLFNYFSNQPNSFKILIADFVTEGDGTGVVHMAPGFGEDDQILCQKYGIELVCPVDNAGKFTSQVPDLEGLLVFDANDKIIIKLKEQKSWLKTEQILHNYPHCWRTDTPLIYKAVPSWYVKVTAFKDKMCELNQKINWIPANVKDGLFGKWLENAKDWAISRNRFWGSPIPVWKSDNPDYPRLDVYGSIEELEKDFNIKIRDLHRPFIDKLVRPNPDDPAGKSMMRRVEDVFDCWFESGSMPFAQVHYPFENKEWFEQHFPADFIVEYAAQTRGWFYTLMVLSTALFDRPPFLNCICHGVILDSSGHKLSKRLNNYTDPLLVFDQYSADALRILMLSSNVVKGQELLIDKDNQMIFEALRLIIKPIWNAYNFFTLYANVDGIKASEVTVTTSLSNLDLYILIKLKLAVEQINAALTEFNSIDALKAISQFFELLNNWYIRRSRNRFWKSQQDEDKAIAYNVLYTVLIIMTKAMAPLLPFLAEEIYQALSDQKPISVHLTDFPYIDFIPINEELVQNMDIVLDVCTNALYVRNNENVRIRQPLASLSIIAETSSNIKGFEDLIKDEINVKEINYLTNLADYAERKLSLNFPMIGKRLTSKMQAIIAASKANNWYEEGGYLNIAGIKLSAEEFTLTLQPKASIKGTQALSTIPGMVMLDLNITTDLYAEGLARDMVRFVQQARKDAVLNVTDRILIEFTASTTAVDKTSIIEKVEEEYREFIEEQTLSKITKNCEAPYYESMIELDQQQIKLRIKLGFGDIAT